MFAEIEACSSRSLLALYGRQLSHQKGWLECEEARFQKRQQWIDRQQAQLNDDCEAMELVMSEYTCMEHLYMVMMSDGSRDTEASDSSV